MRCSLFANLTARCIGARCRVISGFFPPTSRHSEARSDSGSRLPARDRTWNLRKERKKISLASLSSGIEPGIFGRREKISLAIPFIGDRTWNLRKERKNFARHPFHRGSNLESPNFRTAMNPMTHHGETPTRAPSSPTRRTRRSVENVTNEHVRRLKTSRRSMCSSRGPFLFVGPPARLLCRSRPVRPVYAGRW